MHVIEDQSAKVAEERFKFLVTSDASDHADELVAYNDIIRFVTQEVEKDMSDQFYKFKCISAHQGLLTHRHPDFKGSRYNVRVEWEDESATYEPLTMIAADDPVSCAMYVKEAGLLELPGW